MKVSTLPLLKLVQRFNLFLENDIYGSDLFKQEPDPKPDDEDPKPAFRISHILDILEDTEIGVFGVRHMEDEVRWGPVRVVFTPNFFVIISRRCQDLQGDYVWICKKAFAIDVDNYIGHEDRVADDIIEEVQYVAGDPIDRPDRDYKRLNKLVAALAKESTKPSHDLEYKETYKNSETQYTIELSVKTGGTGLIQIQARHAARFTPFITIVTAYDKVTGIINIAVQTVSIESEGGAWVEEIPLFQTNFLPSQNNDEIIKPIFTMLRHY